MCGICGVFAYGAGESAVDAALVQRMSDRMSHRGPDDAGLYVSPDRRLGLGFRRLSIVDLSPTGHQPMTNEDGRLWIVFNGEIYNHEEHRPRLLAKGHSYRGRSDTETILHLYEEHGEDCVHHLRGMFAFAIWDERQGRLFLARDRVGIKPLYYAQLSGTFLFASEIKALLAHPKLSPALNEEALPYYLTFMVPPAPLTLFEGVFKLPSGCRATIDRSGELKVDRYWDPLENAETARVQDVEDAAARLRSLLEESVRLRMMSDVPVGAFLSGGVDSSSIVALMARHSSQPVNTFTVGYKDSPASNELVYARQVAQGLGTRHHEVMIDGQDMVEYMPQLVHTQDEPIADPVCVPLYYVSRLAHEAGVKVVLVGEGSDELFCGYPWYRTYLQEDRAWQTGLAVAPERLLRGVWGSASDALGLFGRGQDLRQILDRRRRNAPTFWGGAVVYTGAAHAAVWPAAARAGSSASQTMVAAHLERAARRRPDADFLARMTYLELMHRLPELLLMRVDKITMSVSLEARVPFLDHRLVEAMLPLAAAVKMNGQLKGLLKKAVRGLIPDNIIHRPKQGFPAPVREWFDRLPAGVLDRQVADSALVRRGHLSGEFIRTLLAEHRSGHRDWSVRLWVLYNLSLWHARWIEGVDVA
jgi:asparagine synthase (glutamine-hydrolysing)